MSTAEAREARREAHLEATLFALAACALLSLLGGASLAAGWTLVGVPGWVWLILCVPELLLVGAFAVTAPRRVDVGVLLLVVAGNLCGLGLLIASLVTEKSSELSGGQLLLSGVVVWLTNVIVFGLLYWSLDAGGPMARAERGRGAPDFQFPQDENPGLARPGWYPRLEDYTYVALTNGIAFSPTDAMPLTRGAKTLMGLDTMISIGAILLVAARAVNVLGS